MSAPRNVSRALSAEWVTIGDIRNSNNNLINSAGDEDDGSDESGDEMCDHTSTTHEEGDVSRSSAQHRRITRAEVQLSPSKNAAASERGKGGGRKEDAQSPLRVMKKKIFQTMDRVSDFKQRNNRRMQAQDEHTMSPFAKFRHYGRIPCKFVLSVLIFILLVFIILAYELPASTADEAERKVLQLHFINAVVGDSDVQVLMPGGDYIVDQPTIHLFKRSEVLGAIERVVETYYSLSNIALTDFDMFFNNKGPHGWQKSIQNSTNTTTTNPTTISPVSTTTSAVVASEGRVGGTVSGSGSEGPSYHSHTGRSNTHSTSSTPPTQQQGRAVRYLGKDQLEHIQHRRARYIPAPPPSLTTHVHRAFDGLSAGNSPAADTSLFASGSTNVHDLNNYNLSYFEYVRSQFEEDSVSNPFGIDNDWMLQPVMELYLLGMSARVDWRAETYVLESRNFYLSRSAPLGPFAADKADLPDMGNNDDVSDDDSGEPTTASTAPAPTLRLLTADDIGNVEAPQPFWLDIVCAPRRDPFFVGSYYLPCRTRREVLANVSNNTPPSATAVIATAATTSRRFRSHLASSSPQTKTTTTTTSRHKVAARRRRFQRDTSNYHDILPPTSSQNHQGRSMLAADTTTDNSNNSDPNFHSITPLGLFDQAERLRINFRINQICSVINDKTNNVISLFYRDALYTWEMDVFFTTSLNGQVTVTFPIRHDVRRSFQRFHVMFFAIIAIGVFSFWDLILRVRAIQRIFRFRHMLRRKMKHHLRFLEEERLREEEEAHVAAMATFFQGRGATTSTSDEAATTPGSATTGADGGRAEAPLEDIYIRSPTSPRLATSEEEGHLPQRKSRWGSVFKLVLSDLEAKKRGTVADPLLTEDQFVDEERLAKLETDVSAAEKGHEAPSSSKAIEEAKFHRRWKKSLRADMGMSWHLWATLTDILCLVYVTYTTAAALQMGVTLESGRLLRIVLGLASAGNAMLFVSYFRFFPDLYFMIRATSESAPRLAAFLLGVTPIFLGFVIFFTTVSGHVSTGLFFSLFGTFTTLTFAWFGDNLFPDFESLDNTDYIHIHVVTSFMLMLFVAVAMYCVLNLTLAIVIDSYSNVRKKFGLTVAPEDWFKKQQKSSKSSPLTKGSAAAAAAVMTTKRGLLAATAKHRMREDSLREVKRHLQIIASTYDSSEAEEDTVRNGKRTVVVDKKHSNHVNGNDAAVVGSTPISGNGGVGGEDGPHTKKGSDDGGAKKKAGEEDGPGNSSGFDSPQSLGSPTSVASSEFGDNVDDDYDDDEFEEVKQELQDGDFGCLLADPDMDMGLFNEFKGASSPSGSS